jgi:hypothetical protein
MAWRNMEILVIVAVLVATLVPIAMIGRWILGPIDRAAKFRQAPVRFSIGDFLCLFLAVQIPLTLIYQLVGEEERPLFWLFTVITWVMAPIIWFACARALSKAGIAQGKHRFVFLGLIMPVVYYGLVPFIFLTVAGIVALVMRNPVEMGQSAWLLALWIGLAFFFYVSGRITRRMVRQARGNEPEISDLEYRLQMARAAMQAASDRDGRL